MEEVIREIEKEKVQKIIEIETIIDKITRNYDEKLKDEIKEVKEKYNKTIEKVVKKKIVITRETKTKISDIKKKLVELSVPKSDDEIKRIKEEFSEKISTLNKRKENIVSNATADIEILKTKLSSSSSTCSFDEFDILDNANDVEAFNNKNKLYNTLPERFSRKNRMINSYRKEMLQGVRGSHLKIALRRRSEMDFVEQGGSDFAVKNDYINSIKFVKLRASSQPKSLLWLLKTISQIYTYIMNGKFYKDEFCITFSEFTYRYFENLYGLPTIIERIGTDLTKTVKYYRGKDTRVKIFSNFLKDIWGTKVLIIFIRTWKVFKENNIGPKFDIFLLDARVKKLRTSKVKCLYVLSILKDFFPPILLEVIAEMNKKCKVESIRLWKKAMEIAGYSSSFKTKKQWGLKEKETKESILEVEFFDIICSVSYEYYYHRHDFRRSSANEKERMKMIKKLIPKFSKDIMEPKKKCILPIPVPNYCI